MELVKTNNMFLAPIKLINPNKSNPSTRYFDNAIIESTQQDSKTKVREAINTADEYYDNILFAKEIVTVLIQLIQEDQENSCDPIKLVNKHLDYHNSFVVAVTKITMGLQLLLSETGELGWDVQGSLILSGLDKLNSIEPDNTDPNDRILWNKLILTSLKRVNEIELDGITSTATPLWIQGSLYSNKDARDKLTRLMHTFPVQKTKLQKFSLRELFTFNCGLKKKLMQLEIAKLVSSAEQYKMDTKVLTSNSTDAMNTKQRFMDTVGRENVLQTARRIGYEKQGEILEVMEVLFLKTVSTKELHSLINITDHTTQIMVRNQLQFLLKIAKEQLGDTTNNLFDVAYVSIYGQNYIYNFMTLVDKMKNIKPGTNIGWQIVIMDLVEINRAQMWRL